MAKAERKPIDPAPYNVVLELSAAEAETLRLIVGRFAGLGDVEYKHQWAIYIALSGVTHG